MAAFLHCGAPMTSTTPTPHDAIFKGLLGKPEHARGVLRAAVPPAVAEAIDWQGLEKGRQQGFQEVLLQLLRQRFGDQVDSVVERRVMETPLEQVQAWTKRVLSAATLGELFAN